MFSLFVLSGEKQAIHEQHQLLQILPFHQMKKTVAFDKLRLRPF